MVLGRWRPGWGITPWRPFRELEEIERLPAWPRWRWWRIPLEEMAWAPSIDMYEKEDSFIVRAELPGVNKEDVDISMSGDTLTIKGERKAPADVKAEEYECCEVCYGSFSRSITMPAAVDSDKIEATYENGILEIRLPKMKEAKPAKIQIKAR